MWEGKRRREIIIVNSSRETERERRGNVKLHSEGDEKSFWKVEDWQQICKLPSVAFERERERGKKMLGWETNSRQRDSEKGREKAKSLLCFLLYLLPYLDYGRLALVARPSLSNNVSFFFRFFLFPFLLFLVSIVRVNLHNEPNLPLVKVLAKRREICARHHLRIRV